MKKLVAIYCNISITAEVEALLKEKGIAGYTEFPRIVGTGPLTGPRLDSHVWPGANVGFHIVCDESAAKSLMQGVREFRQTELGTQSGIFAFTTSVDEIVE